MMQSVHCTGLTDPYVEACSECVREIVSDVGVRFGPKDIVVDFYG